MFGSAEATNTIRPSGVAATSGSLRLLYDVIVSGWWNGQAVVEMMWGDQFVVEYYLEPPA